MRHSKAVNHLGRTSSHRNAMLANMASSLILNKRITTTTAKAKALRIYFEPLVTKSKDDSTHSRRIVFSYLQDKKAVTELFRIISPKVAERPGGYTRILKLGTRAGDNAEMAIIELVDFNENMIAEDTSKAKPKTRRRKSSKKKAENAVEVSSVEEKPAENPAPVADAEPEQTEQTENNADSNADDVNEAQETKE